MSMTNYDRASIFGDTYNGVPNPQIPHTHPYPTRYHGPIFTTPKFGLPFKANPYASAPYSGTGDASRGMSMGTQLVIGLVGAAAIGATAGALSSGKPDSTAGARAGAAVGLALGAVYVWAGYRTLQLSKVIGSVESQLSRGGVK